ncbi:MAG TPA: hypothetical protein VJ250_05275, partial [Nitrososphaeraceae archaeon]|nr:hypothetical protein [Nitrososphaeraceae archaeon]
DYINEDLKDDDSASLKLRYISRRVGRVSSKLISCVSLYHDVHACVIGALDSGFQCSYLCRY